MKGMIPGGGGGRPCACTRRQRPQRVDHLLIFCAGFKLASSAFLNCFCRAQSSPRRMLAKNQSRCFTSSPWACCPLADARRCLIFLCPKAGLQVQPPKGKQLWLARLDGLSEYLKCLDSAGLEI